MKIWIALIRGINVGGKHIVPMKELIKLMEAKGFVNVRSYIQSGNLVFQSAQKPKDEISLLIEQHFGFKPDVFVLNQTDFQKAIANNPYTVDEGKSLHFFFCDKTPTSVDYNFLDSIKVTSESYKLIDNIFYLHTPDGIGRSKLAEKMGKAFAGVNMTARNLNTINKLADMIEM